MERAGDVGPAESDTDDELEDATEAESAALAAADTTEIGVEEALALLGADDGDQGDGKEVYSPDPDVRLIRNVWARKGVMERVRGVKYIYVGLVCLYALLHRRFGMLESDSCSCCPNTIESPWHVIGECNDDVAVQARSEWGDRMWEVLRKETTVQSGRTALRTDVADAMKRLWARDEHGRILAWTPGSVGPVGGCLMEDVEMRELLEGVAAAGSWAVWMGVFSRSWMKLLTAGGLSHKRARIVTGKISAIISECRCAVAKVRHERAARESAEAMAERRRILELDVRKYHAMDK